LRLDYRIPVFYWRAFWRGREIAFGASES